VYEFHAKHFKSRPKWWHDSHTCMTTHSILAYCKNPIKTQGTKCNWCQEWEICLGFVLLLIGWENSMFGLHSASSKSMLPNRPFYQYSSHFDFYWFEKHYRMLRGHISMYLPPMHPIISIGNNGFQNGCCIGKMVYLIRLRSEVSSIQLLVKKHHQWGKS